MTQRRRRTPRDPRFADYPDDFLACRVDRHDLPGIMTPDEAQRWRYPDADVLATRRKCRRCGAVEVRLTNELDGTLYRPTRYDYPEGYLLRAPEGVEGPTPRPVARLEQVRRFLDRNPTPQRRFLAPGQ